jgi:hypothetical protein
MSHVSYREQTNKHVNPSMVIHILLLCNVPLLVYDYICVLYFCVHACIGLTINCFTCVPARVPIPIHTLQFFIHSVTPPNTLVQDGFHAGSHSPIAGKTNTSDCMHLQQSFNDFCSVSVEQFLVSAKTQTLNYTRTSA